MERSMAKKKQAGGDDTFTDHNPGFQLYREFATFSEIGQACFFAALMLDKKNAYSNFVNDLIESAGKIIGGNPPKNQARDAAIAKLQDEGTSDGNIFQALKANYPGLTLSAVRNAAYRLRNKPRQRSHSI